MMMAVMPQLPQNDARLVINELIFFRVGSDDRVYSDPAPDNYIARLLPTTESTATQHQIII